MTSYLQSLLDRYSKLAVYDRQDVASGAESVQSQSTKANTLSQLVDTARGMKFGNALPAMPEDRLSTFSRLSTMSQWLPRSTNWDPGIYRDLAETQFSREYLTDSIEKEIRASDSYYAKTADACERFSQKMASLLLQSLDPEGTGHGPSVQTENARNAGQGASNRRATKVATNHQKSHQTNKKGKTKMKLPHVKGSKRGPKRIAMARKIAKSGHKNWHARASMWLDGLSGTHA